MAILQVLNLVFTVYAIFYLFYLWTESVDCNPKQMHDLAEIWQVGLEKKMARQIHGYISVGLSALQRWMKVSQLAFTKGHNI